MHARMAATNKLAFQWLGQGQRSAELLATAQRLMQAQRVVHQVLAGPMGQACQVARIEGTCMTLVVPSAAHAAKLRQLGPELCRQLVLRGWAITDVQARITMQASVPRLPPVPRHTVPLDAVGLQAFKQLAQGLPPGELADAVQRLLQHHQAKRHSRAKASGAPEVTE